LSSRPAARVIDPFLGSGTVAAAARAAGLSYTGIEADERWCRTAARRLAAPQPAR
jgi:DNA modification methylase